MNLSNLTTILLLPNHQAHQSQPPSPTAGLRFQAGAPGPASSLLVPPLPLGFQKPTAPITHGPRPQAQTYECPPHH